MAKVDIRLRQTKDLNIQDSPFSTNRGGSQQDISPKIVREYLDEIGKDKPVKEHPTAKNFEFLLQPVPQARFQKHFSVHINQQAQNRNENNSAVLSPKTALLKAKKKDLRKAV